MGKLFNELKRDMLYQHGMNACLNCGVCTAVCPAAEFNEYSSRGDKPAKPIAAVGLRLAWLPHKSSYLLNNDYHYLKKLDFLPNFRTLNPQLTGFWGACHPVRSGSLH